MRLAILELFRRNPGEYLSGEEISRIMNVSRTAVWKHIRALKQSGYDIEAHTRLGYCLRQTTDRLLPAEIHPRLTTKLIAGDISHIRYLDTVESTNNEAKKIAFAGCPSGTIVVAEEQASGRGRMSRGWFSPYGKGIWLSVVLRPPFGPQEAPKCTLMAAVAVCRAISKITQVACGIKWPNDILWQGRKLVGILTEMSAEMDAINHVVIGIGVNVNIAADEFPAELRPIAASLSMASKSNINRLDLMIALLQELENIYATVVKEGFATILDEWRSLSITLGQTVDVFGLERNFTGVATDIDQDGALLVRTATGVERVLAGDVSIRKAYP